MIRQRDPRQPEADAGMTLIEVVVALMIFAIIATGIVDGMATISRMTADDRSRVVAANLAAEDIDLVRAINDPFKVSSAVTTRDITGRLYTVTRKTSWVSEGGQDISCGSGTNIFYLRVDTKVTWQGQLVTTAPVQTDVVLAPVGRITDPTTGTISVNVTGADGSPAAGVTVTIVPTAGGAALASQPVATNADGCTYATKVVPGTYAVTINRSGYIDSTQQKTPTKSAVVSVGATAAVSFQYSAGATYPVVYASNYTASTPLLPTDLTATFINTTAGLYVTQATSTVVLHPYSSGYTAVAGTLGDTGGTTSCASVDPAAWPAGTVGTVALAAGQRSPTVAAPAGGTAGDLDVPMGVVKIKATGSFFLTAVSATPEGADNPGCTTTTTLTFGKALRAGTVAVALPFGSWSLYSGTTSNPTTPIGPADLSVPTNAAGGGVSTSGVVTLDPRIAK